MNIKKILAVMLVLVVGYVTIYAYFHPEELTYRVDDKAFIESEVPKEPLVKETNPFVYYFLKYDWVLVLAGILYWIIDLKHSKKLINKMLKWFDKNFQDFVDD